MQKKNTDASTKEAVDITAELGKVKNTRGGHLRRHAGAATDTRKGRPQRENTSKAEQGGGKG